MKLKELYERADALAPFSLSREFIETFGQYDNSGILLDCGEALRGVLFSLDLSSAAVARAKELGYNCVFTHHPAIFAPLKSLSEREGARVLACAKEHISVISAHLNLDAAEGGIDESLMHALGGAAPLAVMEQLSLGGYGRVYDVEEQSLAEFARRAKEKLGAERVLVYGEGTVKRAASFCGAGFDEKSLSFACAHGADVLVSSDGKHHLIAEAAERGIGVVLLTHYAAENYGFKLFFERMKASLGVPCAYFSDERFL